MDTLKTLEYLGDQLDGTDDVQEQNQIGFNKADKSVWSLVRGNESAMKALLLKYRKQLTARFGAQLVDSIDWTLEDSSILKKVKEAKRAEKRAEAAEAKRLAEIADSEASVEVTAENGGYGLRLKSKKRIDRNRFEAFVNYVRAQGGRCDVTRNYLWTVKPDFDFAALKEHLAQFSIELSNIPHLAAQKPQAPKPDVFVTRGESGVYNIYHHYSERQVASFATQSEKSDGFFLANP